MSRPHRAARAEIDRTLRAIEILEVALRLLVPAVPKGERLTGAAARDAAIRDSPRRLRAELDRLRVALRGKAEDELGAGVGREIYDKE